jgi:hypothetical protein
VLSFYDWNLVSPTWAAVGWQNYSELIASRLPGQFPAPIEYLESLWADEIPQEGLMRNNRVYRKRLDTLQFFDIPFMWHRPLKSWVLYFGDLAQILNDDSGKAPRPLPDAVYADPLVDGVSLRASCSASFSYAFRTGGFSTIPLHSSWSQLLFICSITSRAY